MDTNITKDVLETLFRHSTDGVCAVCMGRVIYANPASVRLFERDVTGQSAGEVFSMLDFTSGAETYATSLRLHGREFPVTVQPGDGLHLVYIRPLPDTAPTVPGAVMQQLRSSVFSLRVSLERMLTEYGRESDPCGSAALHSYYSLLRQVRQLSAVNDLQKGTMLCRMEGLDLAALAAELIGSVRTLLHDRPVEILYSLPEKSVPVRGDRERLSELLLALLLNSLQHTPAGGRILVELKLRGRQALLTVSDNGEGVDAAHLSTLFAPVDGGLNACGAGLGLTVVQGIARLHGGAAVAESREGKGTKVCVTLPLTAETVLRDNARYEAPGAELLLTELAPILGGDAYGAQMRD